VQRDTQVHEAARRIGRRAHRRFEQGHGFVQTAGRLEQRAEIRQGVGIAGLRRDRAAVCSFGRLRVALLPVAVAQVVKRVDVVRLERQQ
jgi:hypothetical protein